MSKSLGNVVDPVVIVEGGNNEKQEPAYGADVLRLWVSSVDYSADVPLGPGIIKQLADVSRKVRNTARYLLGNLHDFDPRPQGEGGDAVPIEALPLLDRWMLQRTATLIEEVGGDFERYEFYRFFQALQNFCVVDLSNFYLDIAKDRLYVSAPGSFRRRSCQTVMALVVERLAGLIAPVLCHMAEDIWQNLPYPVAESSVFERGWPLAAAAWSLSEAERAAITSLQGLRALVNRQLEACRNTKAGQPGIGSSLETRVQLVLGSGPGATPFGAALEQLELSPCPEVDNLADWLLVSELQVVGAPPADLLAESLLSESLLSESLLVESGDDDLTIRIFRADGEKCERCWHYETHVSDHMLNGDVSGRICGRCNAILNSLPG